MHDASKHEAHSDPASFHVAPSLHQVREQSREIAARVRESVRKERIELIAELAQDIEVSFTALSLSSLPTYEPSYFILCLSSNRVFMTLSTITYC